VRWHTQCREGTSTEANEIVLLDRAGHFSARLGWERVLGLHFARIQVKAVPLPLLRHWQWTVPQRHTPSYA
jgi:hypothetical protein